MLGKIQKSTKLFLFQLIKEVTNINKDSYEGIITTSYKIKFIDSATFMASSLSNLVDNLAEEIHKIKCKDCLCVLECKSVKVNLIKYKCLSCNKHYSNQPDEKFKKWRKNTFKFSNNDINKFILLLRKGVYPYEYMDEWKMFKESILSKTEEFYSNLNIEDITGAN